MEVINRAKLPMCHPEKDPENDSVISNHCIEPPLSVSSKEESKDQHCHDDLTYNTHDFCEDEVISISTNEEGYNGKDLPNDDSTYNDEEQHHKRRKKNSTVINIVSQIPPTPTDLNFEMSKHHDVEFKEAPSVYPGWITKQRNQEKTRNA